MGMHLRRRPLVEPLESCALLSGTPMTPPPMTPPIVIPPMPLPHQHVIALAGTVTGTYTERSLPPGPTRAAGRRDNRPGTSDCELREN